jgi:uncharacterized protein YbjT (DUF2867 family)
VALSIVGTDRTDDGYFCTKVAQEKLIEASGIPYTIIRARPSSSNFSAASPLKVPMEIWSGFRPSCSSPSRQTTLLPSSPGGARRTAKRHRRDRRPGTSAV